MRAAVCTADAAAMGRPDPAAAGVQPAASTSCTVTGTQTATRSSMRTSWCGPAERPSSLLTGLASSRAVVAQAEIANRKRKVLEIELDDLQAVSRLCLLRPLAQPCC